MRVVHNEKQNHTFFVEMIMARYQDFETIVRTMGDLPPSPLVATKLLDLLHAADTETHDLVATLSLDPETVAKNSFQRKSPKENKFLRNNQQTNFFRGAEKFIR